VAAAVKELLLMKLGAKIRPQSSGAGGEEEQTEGRPVGPSFGLSVEFNRHAVHNVGLFPQQRREDRQLV